MPTELPEPRDSEVTDLERYGRWQHGLLFIGLFLLGVVIAKWLWGGQGQTQSAKVRTPEARVAPSAEPSDPAINRKPAFMPDQRR